MTRKDYALIAKCIHEQYSKSHQFTLSDDVIAWGHGAICYSIKELVANLATRLQNENPRFNRDKFVKACFEGEK